LIGYSQNDLPDFVNKYSVAINSIHPDSTDFSDLENIGNAIGDARIVLLGEQDHGDAPAFLAKTRLVNYLHAKKGFTVIAFESDFFSATYGFENNAKTIQGYLSFYKANIVPYWTLSDACNELFTQLIPQSFSLPNRLIIAGFDNQMFYKYAATNLSKTIDSLARHHQLEILNNPSTYSSILLSIDTLSNSIVCTTKSKEYYKQSIANLLTLKKQFQEKLNGQAVVVLLIDNLVAFANQLLVKNDFTAMCNIRDNQMANNLQWLCTQKFPKEKIIVWAANYHISKYMGHFSKKVHNNNISMATQFVKDSTLNKETYALGFTSFNGEAGRIGTKTFVVNKPHENGFERWINPAFDYAFTDFKKFNLLHPNFNNEFELKSCVSANEVHKSHLGQWNKIFDGIFFIRHMYPCNIKTN
jgi:erythromycin esterase